ncbi:hypothetical protein JCM10212_004736 [Sporobolomyces blumeae]
MATLLSLPPELLDLIVSHVVDPFISRASTTTPSSPDSHEGNLPPPDPSSTPRLDPPTRAVQIALLRLVHPSLTSIVERRWYMDLVISSSRQIQQLLYARPRPRFGTGPRTRAVGPTTSSNWTADASPRRLDKDKSGSGGHFEPRRLETLEPARSDDEERNGAASGGESLTLHEDEDDDDESDRRPTAPMIGLFERTGARAVETLVFDPSQRRDTPGRRRASSSIPSIGTGGIGTEETIAGTEVEKVLECIERAVSRDESRNHVDRCDDERWDGGRRGPGDGTRRESCRRTVNDDHGEPPTTTARLTKLDLRWCRPVSVEVLRGKRSLANLRSLTLGTGLTFPTTSLSASSSSSSSSAFSFKLDALTIHNNHWESLPTEFLRSLLTETCLGSRSSSTTKGTRTTTTTTKTSTGTPSDLNGDLDESSRSLSSSPRKVEPCLERPARSRRSDDDRRSGLRSLDVSTMYSVESFAPLIGLVCTSTPFSPVSWGTTHPLVVGPSNPPPRAAREPNSIRRRGDPNASQGNEMGELRPRRARQGLDDEEDGVSDEGESLEEAGETDEEDNEEEGEGTESGLVKGFGRDLRVVKLPPFETLVQIAFATALLNRIPVVPRLRRPTSSSSSSSSLARSTKEEQNVIDYLEVPSFSSPHSNLLLVPFLSSLAAHRTTLVEVGFRASPYSPTLLDSVLLVLQSLFDGPPESREHRESRARLTKVRLVKFKSTAEVSQILGRHGELVVDLVGQFGCDVEYGEYHDDG